MNRGKREKSRTGSLFALFLIILASVVVALNMPDSPAASASDAGAPGAETPAASIAPTPAPTPIATPEPTAAPTPTPEPTPVYDYSQPVPESAAVEDDWFADAVFIGDSRTEGFKLYSGLKTARYYASRGLAVDTVFTEPLIPLDGQTVSVIDALRAEGDFQKAYIMLGINELGWVSVEAFIDDYAAIIDALREINPDVQIYVQSILPVTREKSETDSIYNNPRIDVFNSYLRDMCQDKEVYYLDVAEAVRDNDGVLPEDAATDGVHLSREYCEKWLAYLKTHTVGGAESGDKQGQ